MRFPAVLHALTTFKVDCYKGPMLALYSGGFCKTQNAGATMVLQVYCQLSIRQMGQGALRRIKQPISMLPPR